MCNTNAEVASNKVTFHLHTITNLRKYIEKVKFTPVTGRASPTRKPPLTFRKI